MLPTTVFYHLFATNHWRLTFARQMESLVKSGLYAACNRLNIGIVADGKGDLAEAVEAASAYDKARIVSAGRNIPALGEAQTILRMVEEAASAPQSAFLFTHSKGVTNPPSTRRHHHSYFIERGLDSEASDTEANDFILDELSSVFSNWRAHVAALASDSLFFYRLFNVFWVRTDLLQRFDYDEYVRSHRTLAPPQQRQHGPDDDWQRARHVFALFPVKLFAFQHRIPLTEPPYSYIDVDGTL